MEKSVKYSLKEKLTLIKVMIENGELIVCDSRDPNGAYIGGISRSVKNIDAKPDINLDDVCGILGATINGQYVKIRIGRIDQPGDEIFTRLD